MFQTVKAFMPEVGAPIPSHLRAFTPSCLNACMYSYPMPECLAHAHTFVPVLPHAIVPEVGTYAFIMPSCLRWAPMPSSCTTSILARGEWCCRTRLRTTKSCSTSREPHAAMCHATVQTLLPTMHFERQSALALHPWPHIYAPVPCPQPCM